MVCENFKNNRHVLQFGHGVLEKWNFIFLLGVIHLFSGGCEMNRTVPLDDPVYHPQLMIHGMASPRSGAEVGIHYSEPLPGKKAEIPGLPALEIFLLRDGETYLRFGEDSVGSFSIPAEDLSLEMNRDYALEVRDFDSGEVFISGNSQLPEQPDLLFAQATQAKRYRGRYYLELSLGPVEEFIEAISIYPVILDSLGVPVTRLSQWQIQEVTPWNKVRAGVQYMNEEKWKVKDLLIRQNRSYLGIDEKDLLSENIDLYVSYLSGELTSFIQDIEESFYSGENIFEIVRPIYSNFQNTSGVFGLYNEVKLELEIK